ncbi:hypothetical protein [Stenotrophomonas maltophilia]|nr:hypothetical protein [Stenotrophomonas maltophilia]
MTQHKTSYAVIDIYHITSPAVALEMVVSQTFRSHYNFRSYDGGMNFCGVLGRVPNTQPVGSGARLHCKWDGLVSEPLSPESYDYHTPNVLFDFNGSGEYCRNNDPRYFLPYGSMIQVSGVECDPSALHDYYLSRSPFFRKSMYRFRSKEYQCAELQSLLDYYNEQCAAGGVKLEIQRGPPTFTRGGGFFG